MKEQCCRVSFDCVFYIYLSEIGPGWNPAMINSSLELQFIVKQHMRLANSRSYHIGGSTLATGHIDLFDYMRHLACPGTQCKI